MGINRDMYSATGFRENLHPVLLEGPKTPAIHAAKLRGEVDPLAGAPENSTEEVPAVVRRQAVLPSRDTLLPAVASPVGHVDDRARRPTQDYVGSGLLAAGGATTA